jgi:guanylate kinase
VYVTAPDLLALESRLLTRVSSSDIRGDHHDIQDWIDKARENYDSFPFDLKIINDDLEVSYQEFKTFALGSYFADFEKNS